MAKIDNGPARGTRDFLPATVARREVVIDAIARSYTRFGFRRVETPALESIERLSSGQGGDNEKLIYKILRRGLEELQPGMQLSELTDLALRYDLTVPLSRFYANNHSQLGVPFRALQIGSVWRAERPAKGRYRQFTQCDIDTLGESSVLAECELLEATATTLLSLSIAPITVRVNDRRLLAAIASASGVPAAATDGYFVTLDKLDKIGWEGVRRELVEARGLEPGVAALTEELLEKLRGAATARELLGLAGECLPALDEHVLDDLAVTASALEELVGTDGRLSFVLDPTIVRGMGYYTGQIFEIAHESSSGSIAGGGRYDNLLGRSLGRAMPACGISIGFERVVDLASVESPDLGVAVLYGDEPVTAVLAVAREIRRGGRPAALVPKRKALHQQLDALQAEGYSAFVTLEDGAGSSVRPLGSPAS